MLERWETREGIGWWMSQEQAEPREVGVDRLLAFSDGVFAIAITLLVLDLHDPIVAHGLLDALLKQWPAYLSYVLSFLIIGILWVQHHAMFRSIRRTDHLFLLINVVFLMWIAVLPFPTALLARYLDSPTEQHTATSIYTGAFVIGGLLFNLLWRYATHRDRLLGEQVDRQAIRKTTRSYAAGPVLYLLDFALSFISPTASIVLFFLLALFYAIAPLPLFDRFLP